MREDLIAMRWLPLFLAAMVAASLSEAATFTEDFSSNPLADGWQIFGNTNLFQWDSLNQDLQVTWDSSQPNSYFYHPLGTILSRDDDFELSFDLTLQDDSIGTTPGQPFTFEISLGFLNLVNATQTNFSRGSGVNAVYGPVNLVEFNFFPAFSIYQPTIDQVMVATNNSSWLYNENNLLDLPPGDLFHIDMSYLGSPETLTTILTLGGVQYGETQVIQVPTGFDFRVGVVSVSSYSDRYSDGSILAHGIVDNFAVTVPPPPVQNLTGAWSNGVFQVQFLSRSNWLYTLQRTGDFQSWAGVSSVMTSNAMQLLMKDASPTPGKAFYRVSASRP
ncbi:MAG: hypothetical protein ABSA69_04835 [Verrucomicrobiota bacterium]